MLSLPQSYHLYQPLLVQYLVDLHLYQPLLVQYLVDLLNSVQYLDLLHKQHLQDQS